MNLLIIAPSYERPLDRRLKLRRMLSKYDRKFGLDLLVYTPDEFEMLAKETSSFIYSAIKQGIKIYDRKTSPPFQYCTLGYFVIVFIYLIRLVYILLQTGGGINEKKIVS